MGRKKSKNKDKERSPSPTPSSSPTPKALSEHSDEICKTMVKTTEASLKPHSSDETIKKWVEELSQSPEVIKALQSMASSMASSSGETGMTPKTKAIVPAHGTTSLSQTVDSKDLSNPLKAVGLPKIQSSQIFPRI